MTRGPKRQRANLQGLNQKKRSLDGKHSSLDREGNDVKGPHASAHKLGITQEASGEEAGAELG
jgi:hypothetical protein